MRWPFRQKERDVKGDTGLQEARRARQAAEERLAVTYTEVTVPLRELHQVNHIQPLINGLLQKYAADRKDKRD